MYNMTSVLSTLFDTKLKYPTTLMEISERNYKRFTDNTIHVKGISVIPKGKDPSEILYSSVVYGKYVDVKNTKVDKALSTAERDSISKSRGQGLQGHPNVNKRHISNVYTADEGEVEENPPNAGT